MYVFYCQGQFYLVLHIIMLLVFHIIVLQVSHILLKSNPQSSCLTFSSKVVHMTKKVHFKASAWKGKDAIL